MVSAEEKRELVQTAINMAWQQIQSSEIQHQLHTLLLRDTLDGKLYKYHSFDAKGYALRNLKSGTLHCSKPAVFNDPFDCKIGVTLSSLYEAIYEKEFELVTEVFVQFINVMDEKIAIKDCNVDAQRIIRRLLSSKKVARFAAENRGKVKTDEEFAELLKAHALDIIELMQMVLTDEAFSDSFRSYASLLPHIIEQITPEGMRLLSNNNATFVDYARANGIMEDTDEIGLTLLLGTKLRPDLAESAENMQRFIEDIEHRIADKMGSMFLVGCLCTDFKNRLMWSHYADSHKGFCVEYDFSSIDEDTLLTLPFPIFYTENRPIIPWKATIETTQQKIDEASAQLMLGLLTKDSAWEYENEWRIIIGSGESSELKMPNVSCIYLGAAIREEDRSVIINIAKQLCVPVKQMTLDRGAYALHAIDYYRPDSGC